MTTNVADEYVEALDEIFGEFDSAADKKTKEDKLGEAKDELAQLKLCLGSAKPDKKEEIKELIKMYETKIEQRSRELLTGASSRSGSRGSGPGGQMTAQEKQEDSLAKLEDARRQLYETEQVAADTMSHLSSQRETIERSRTNLKETNTELRKANGLLTGMSKWWRA